MALRIVWSSFRVVILLAVMLGIVYTLLMTGIAQLVFPYQANGSLVKNRSGTVIGSALIGQYFTSPGYFHGRPSATVSLATGKPKPYNAKESLASNLAPTNPTLIKDVKARVSKILAANPGVKKSQIPISMVESTDSGLDPAITPADAYLQVRRVAAANHLPVAKVRALVTSHVRGRFLFIFGHSYVNVLKLNIAISKMTHTGGF